MYSLGTQGEHLDPGATDDGACESLVDGLINTMKEISPVRSALVALVKMDPTERTQGWPPENFEHGMRISGEPLVKVRTFQAHVTKLAMEACIWAARCRLVHPDGTTGLRSKRFPTLVSLPESRG